MENYKEQLNQYEKILEERNRLYKEHLDSKLEQYRSVLQEQKKDSFENGLKDMQEIAEKIRVNAENIYKKELIEIKNTNDEFLKARRLKSAEKMLEVGYELAQGMVNNYIRDFS